MSGKEVIADLGYIEKLRDVEAAARGLKFEGVSGTSVLVGSWGWYKLQHMLKALDEGATSEHD